MIFNYLLRQLGTYWEPRLGFGYFVLPSTSAKLGGPTHWDWVPKTQSGFPLPKMQSRFAKQ
jgi:hypothetical protein